MRLGLLVAILALVLASAALFTPTYADGCETYSWQYDPGKTPEGFKASANDGCHTVNWTSNTTDVTGNGVLKFTTIDPAIQPWESGYTLPGPQGGNFCEYRAAHEANLYFGNKFHAPPGTEVTVVYRCY